MKYDRDKKGVKIIERERKGRSWTGNDRVVSSDESYLLYTLPIIFRRCILDPLFPFFFFFFTTTIHPEINGGWDKRGNEVHIFVTRVLKKFTRDKKREIRGFFGAIQSCLSVWNGSLIKGRRWKRDGETKKEGRKSHRLNRSIAIQWLSVKLIFPNSFHLAR